MRHSLAALAMLALVASACINMDPVTAIPDPLSITPSRPPSILSPTPILVYPTFSATPTATASLPATETPTQTVTATFTATPTNTEPPSKLGINLLGCGMGFDLTHGMGEVTNAYVTIVNASGLDLTTVCATLSAADEGRPHPDKTACVPSLPNGTQVTLKLTIDTTFQVNTIVGVDVTSSEGIPASVSDVVCNDLGTSQPAPETIGVAQPIP